jgi:hypothetical protein
MDALAALELAFRHTEGEQVTIGDVVTWGHLDAVSPSGFGAAGVTASSAEAAPLVRVVTIPRQAYPALQIGGTVTVGAVEEVVRGIAPAERDPALLRVLLLDWTHVVTLYRPGVSGANDRGRRRTGWTQVVAGVRGTIVPGAGELEGEVSGQVSHAAARGSFLPGSGFQVGDGVRVTEGPGPARYIVQAVADFGSTWGARVDLAATLESFG